MSVCVHVTDNYQESTIRPKIYLKTSWGLGNRLRVIRVALAVAETLSADLYFVNSYDEQNFNVHDLRDLFTLSSQHFFIINEEPPKEITKLTWGSTDCTFKECLIKEYDGHV